MWLEAMTAGAGFSVNMPIQRLPLQLLAFLAGTIPGHALDLTPNPSFRELEGIKIPTVNFADGASKVTWQPPTDWRLSGGGNHLTLYPTQQIQAAVDLKVVDRKVAQVSVDPAEVAKWIVNFLPRDATEVTLGEEVTNPFMLRSAPCREIPVSYLSQNRRLSTSVSIVDLDERQSLMLVVTARQDDFATVRRQAIQSMFLWSWEK